MIEAFSPSCGTKYLLLHYPISMADQYGLTPEDHIIDLKLLSDARYIQGMLILDLFEQITDGFSSRYCYADGI